jgi:hypothetical protein
MKSVPGFVLFGAALAFILGAVFVRRDTPQWEIILIALAVVGLSWFFYLYKPRRWWCKTQPGAVLVVGSRQWAEALYRQQLISKQELDDYLKTLQT